VRWRPALVGRVLRRLGRAAVQRVRRALQHLRSGWAFRDDAAPKWMED
jgi:hypothetical protein